MSPLSIAKNWTLPLAMLAGVLLYSGCAAINLPLWFHVLCNRSIGIVQPMLIFAMLYITFCKIELSELRLAWWHAAGLLFQCGLFCLLAFVSQTVDEGWSIIIEGGMVCLICPTATAAAVVTQKLGGSAGGLTTYTILINLCTALVVAAVIPMIHPQQGMTFATDFLLIIAKVMPLLFLPIVAALLTRRYVPGIPQLFKRHPDLAFYLWCVALALAIAVTVRSIVHSSCSLASEIGIAVTSALVCAAQFAFGRYIGGRYDDTTRITAGQSLGQKNTVFAIWMGYTFLDPITSIAGGFYSVWHNVFNSWQLYNKRKTQS